MDEMKYPDEQPFNFGSKPFLNIKDLFIINGDYFNSISQDYVQRAPHLCSNVLCILNECGKGIGILFLMWSSLLLVFTVPTGLVIILAAIYMRSCTLGTVLGALHILSQSQKQAQREVGLRSWESQGGQSDSDTRTLPSTLYHGQAIFTIIQKQGGWRSRLAAGLSLVSLPPTVASENSTNMTDSMLIGIQVRVNFYFLARC